MGCKVLCPSVALLAYLIICQHVRAQCTQPSFASRNVIFTSEHLSSQSFPAGSTVTFECVIGHKPANLRASRSVTCQGNQWTSLELSCTRKSCGSLADFLHGRYEMNGNLFGDTAKPVCDTGYMLAGQETSRTCRDQGWDGRDPLCEPVKCSAPPDIENGQLEDEPFDSYDYLQAVSYRCNGRLNLIGQSTLFCSEDGTFKPDPPKCFDGCPVPMIPNAKRIGGKSPPYKLGNFVKYKCDDGYTMNGEDYIVCRANGWDPEPPRCIEPCGLPELSEHVTLTEEFHSRRTFPHGSNVTVECIHGYEPVDATVSKTITCEQTKWTKSLLTCKALPTTPTTATTTTTPTTAVTSTTATTAVTSTTPTTAVTSRTATTRTAAVTSTTPTTAVTSTTATTPTTAVTSTTPTTAVTSRTATTAVTSTTPTTAVTSTTTTTATTAVTSTVRTTYKAPKEKEDTTNTTTWAKALLGIGGVVVGAGLLYFVFKYFKKQSKHTYSDKVATNNEEDPL